jgi:hypothetical protein
MDQDQDGNAIQALPFRPAGITTDGAFEPLVLTAAGDKTLTIDVSDSALLRWEARDAAGLLQPIFVGIDGELTDAAAPAGGDKYESKAFDVIGCGAIDTVRFTIGLTDVTIYGRRS